MIIYESYNQHTKHNKHKNNKPKTSYLKIKTKTPNHEWSQFTNEHQRDRSIKMHRQTLTFHEDLTLIHRQLFLAKHDLHYHH